MKLSLGRLAVFYLGFTVVFLSLGGAPSPCSAANPADLSDPQASLKKLFRIDTGLVQKRAPGPHTFVIFVNGAADHFVPPSFSEVNQKWGKADAKDVQEIKEAQLACESCNLLLLHIQRGGARWFTPKHPYATYLRGYSAGKKIFSRHVDLLNAADPKALSLLLNAAQTLFPGTDLHLIYRGHGFYPAYDPQATLPETAPFDSNFKNSPFGITQWVEGIQGAKLTRPLASVTFAACSMAYLEVAEKLAPYANSMIASQIPVIETLKFGFDYDFFRLIPFVPNSDRSIPKILASTLMERFQTGAPSLDTKTEEPITLIDLSKIPRLKAQLEAVITHPWVKAKLAHQAIRQDWIKKARVFVAPSNRHIKSLIQSGKPEKEALAYTAKYQSPVRNPHQLDFFSFLTALKQSLMESDPDQASESELQLKQQISNLIAEFKNPDFIEVFNASAYAKHAGLNFDARSLPLEPRE